MKRFFYLVSFLILVSACKEVFEAPPQSLLQASLVNSSTGNALSSTVTVLGIGVDSYLVKDSTLKAILLPLSPTDTTIYQISLDSDTDTITLIHDKIMEYVSMDSGLYYEFVLKSVYSTHNRIDSIQISDSLVTKKWNENIKLYIRPLPAGSN